MLRKVDHKQMGTSHLGWLNSTFHFSFAEYYNPENIRFGALRVINDDLIAPHTGFDLHPHRDMEIISYVVNGALTHQDSMGNKHTITRGQVQYMSAGTGVFHSEHNMGDEELRMLQIWILPDRHGHTPHYGEFLFEMDERKNKWLHMVSDKNGTAPIQINQDANLYAVELEAGKEIDFEVAKGRQAYLVAIEGHAMINNNVTLETRDGLEIVEEDIHIKAEDTAHILVIEMAKID